MGIFPLDFKKLLIIIILISIPLLAINIQRKEGRLSWVVQPFFVTVGFFQDIYSNYSRSIRKTTSLYLNLVDIKKDNRELADNMAVLQTQLSQFEELKKENVRLAQLLGFKQDTPHQLVAARVIGHDVLGQHSTLFIDKGTDDGITPGQAIVTPQGVVGSILNAEKNFAQVLALTDRYSAIDVVIDRSRARAIVEGMSSTKCQLKYLQRTDDVKVGDLVVTTGLDKVFPKGFPVGIVTQVDKKDYGITQDVQMEPLTSVYDAEAVFVVLKTNDKAEIQEKIKEISLKE